MTEDRPQRDLLERYTSERFPSVGAPRRFFAPFLVRGERCCAIPLKYQKKKLYLIHAFNKMKTNSYLIALTFVPSQTNVSLALT